MNLGGSAPRRDKRMASFSNSTGSLSWRGVMNATKSRLRSDGCLFPGCAKHAHVTAVAFVAGIGASFLCVEDVCALV